MTVLVTSALENAIKHAAVVSISCTMCGRELTVTAADKNLARMVEAVGAAHSASCVSPLEQVTPVCGATRRSFVCVGDEGHVGSEDDRGHYFVALADR